MGLFHKSIIPKIIKFNSYFYFSRTYLLNGACNHRGHFAAFRPNALKSSGEPLASSQAADLSDPAPRRAPSIRLSHDNGGLPLLRFHAGGSGQEMIRWTGSEAGSRAICPNIDSWRLRIKVEMFSIEASSSNRQYGFITY